MAHTKSGKTTKGSRDAQPKYLGVKHHGGEKVTAGSIIVRQRGSKFHPGEGTALGRDYTLFATVDGVVIYYGRRGKQFVSVTQSS
ncbi:MAG: 50S ribosomal protein L27 [Microgenomates group bacterium GW2011_GWC1_41_8]|uniref:Large ribosomal subunit protein bL27 n=3 Tax=Candidatus Roizmaniibacteriota TaxID=1752723 RepID=A0A0G0XAI5_9BACT|nr:MAG: 50S ribosomal protein L27 [Candidatus Levybacteria bacterium GW2011_GWA2_40_16]KKR72249.1 MAG: 50S ribosomal protein L27 [Candidatus Roizmanbacteria bacterium GW2011_GWB1_40_7]KKR95066.1 MAG: 50S ribosomal protein L27 [Candidatus Roizmanbacteria bacterium GW2011_GWA1_41_13]KKS21955.1 MAG: 50S ribosomal protein L27 [Candidatus Roizmanbacteria bacterium GW2011_GWC2_41_7]KKS24821.1 MAG: 50S ribosomal protein L27 [Microgenomates group bacterium GW2011_GWC1_41_8]OGK49105.1 MAG: 50S ribosoma